jgi:hypothetical protein
MHVALLQEKRNAYRIFNKKDIIKETTRKI